MDHDSRQHNQATPSTSIGLVALMASLAPQPTLKPKPWRAHARTGFASKSLSQIPKYQDSYLSLRGEEPDEAHEEMLALLKTRSRSTTKSKSSLGSSSHAPLNSATMSSLNSTSTSTPSTKQKRAQTTPGETSAEMSMDASFASTNTLSPHARRKLLRSARKVGNILGETPILCTTSDAPNAHFNMANTSTAEFGAFPSPPLSSSLQRKASLGSSTWTRPRAEMEFGMYDGLASAYASPNRRADLSLTLAPTQSTSTLNRGPPVLKVDCALVNSKGKRPRQGSSSDDAESFVSTATLARDLFSPHATRRSPLSPAAQSPGPSTSPRTTEKTKAKAREARRSKVAKLSRHLGEQVPAELVFPLEAEPFVLVSYEVTPSSSPIAEITPEGTVGTPATRKGSLRRRKRSSLQIDLSKNGSSSPVTSPIAAAGASPGGVAGSVASKYRPARTLSRSHSVRTRTRKRVSDTQNVRSHPSSAPPLQTVHQMGQEEEEEGQPRTPLSEMQKAIKVRRAQKMISVFGEAPPNALIPNKAICESPVAQTFGGARFKRYSESSILTSSTAFTEIRSRTATDSPTPTPITPEPKEQINVAPAAISTPTSMNAQAAYYHRRSSLSALPDTPPPFARYFEPSGPLSPISPSPLSATQPQNPFSHSLKGSKSPHSPRSPLSVIPSSVNTSPTKVKEDPGAMFRERRQRAAKLARFFGVGYGDLFPAETHAPEELVRAGSFDSLRSLRDADEWEKGAGYGRENAPPGVCVSVQREVDAELGSGLEAKADVLRDLKMTATTTDWDGGAAGCYGFTPPRVASIRRRRWPPSGSPSSVGTQTSLTLSLGRRGPGVNTMDTAGGSIGLTRKGSGKALPLVRDSFVSRGSVDIRSGSGSGLEFGVVSGVRRKEREPARVRVGEKAADVHEVMGRLRELR